MDFAEPDLIGAASDGRTRIVHAARQLFIRSGFKSVSMQQIADAAGVNKATLYHHFADKEDLFVEVLRQEFVQGHHQLNDTVAGHGSLRSQLVNIALHIFTTYRADIGRLMSDLRAHVSEDRRNELLAQASPPWITLKSIFEQAQARGEIRLIDSMLLGRLFFGMIGSQMGWTKFGGADLQPDEETAQAIVDILLGGIAAGACASATSATPTASSADEPALR
jgi:AcrR family transcriptional regulator